MSVLRKWLLTFLKVGVAFGLIFWLLKSGRLNFSNFPLAFRQPLWMAVGITIVFVEIILCAFRWQVLLRGLGIREGIWNLFHFTWIGLLFNNVMPGAVGGDVVKTVYVVRHFPDKKAVTGMTVFLDRFVGLYGLLLVEAMSFTFLPDALWEVHALKVLAAGIWITVGVSFIVIPFFFTDRVRRMLPSKGFISEIALALHSYRSSKRHALLALGLSVLNHLSLVVVLYSFSRALMGGEVEIPFSVMAAIGPVGIATLALPIAPAGLGVGQVAFSQLFGWAGALTPSLGANTVTLFQLVYLFISMLGVVSLVVVSPRKNGHSAVTVS